MEIRPEFSHVAMHLIHTALLKQHQQFLNRTKEKKLSSMHRISSLFLLFS